MRAQLGPIHKSNRQRVFYIICLFFVFSYIAFNVLDLDGSNLPSLGAPLKQARLLAVLGNEVEIPYSSERIVCARTIAVSVADDFADYARFHTGRVVESSLLGLARAHGCRLGLARDDLPD